MDPADKAVQERKKHDEKADGKVVETETPRVDMELESERSRSALSTSQ